MTKRDLLFKIGRACPGLANEIFALEKRLSKDGEFPGPAKTANEDRFLKLCRDALMERDLDDDLREKLEEIAAPLYSHGGRRPGAGRKPTGRKRHQVYVTDKEFTRVKMLIEEMRKDNK